MTITLADAPPAEAPDFKRGQWGKPKIKQLDGTYQLYDRASSIGKLLEDRYHLELWDKRNVAYGMAHDQSLVARVIAVGGAPAEWGKPEKEAVNSIVDDAIRVAKAKARADIGTAVHKMTERIDRGETFDAGPYSADLLAYQAALEAAGIKILPEFIERKIVNDEVHCAGSPDRILVNKNGEFAIGDVKTSDGLLGVLSWGCQLGVYANGVLYDVLDEVRLDTPTINKQVGYIIHLPAGQGRCTIYEIDIAAGYEAAKLATRIRDARQASKQWLTEVIAAEAGATGPDHSFKMARIVEPIGIDDIDRREALRRRRDALGEAERIQFRQMYVAAGRPQHDLDVIEKMLDEIDAFAKVLPKLPMTFDGMDLGEMIPAEDFRPITLALRELPDDVKLAIKKLMAEARRAGVPFLLPATGVAEWRMRDFDILRGLVHLGRSWGEGSEDLIRLLVDLATEDGRAGENGRAELGWIVGTLDAPQAARFAECAVGLVNGELKLVCDESTDGEMMLLPS